MSGSHPRRRRSILTKACLVLVGLMLVDQLILRTAMADGEFLGQPLAPYVPPIYSSAQSRILDRLERELAERPEEFRAESSFDGELGWCSKPSRVRDRVTFDEFGSRVSFEPLREASGRRIALVGCSFTLGSEVGDRDTWVYKLDEHLTDAHFANFGVGGYGLDQALVRYRRDVAPLNPDEVWLGIFPGAILRISSHFPPLYHRWRARTLFFKPRFELTEAGQLELRPSPATTPEAVRSLLEDPAKFLDAMRGDPWLARRPAAFRPLGSHWTHHSAATRVGLTLAEDGGRDATAILRDPTDPLFRLGVAIVLELAHELEERGVRFRCLVFPSQVELRAFGRSGEAFWHPFTRALEERGVEVLDLTPALFEAEVTEDPNAWMPFGHYSPTTHDRVVDELRRRAT